MAAQRSGLSMTRLVWGWSDRGAAYAQSQVPLDMAGTCRTVSCWSRNQTRLRGSARSAKGLGCLGMVQAQSDSR
ncbi:hypothetical protein B5D80_09225 [Micromonospora wenchangensis]|uniref:Uncharacterized protein n=1 Tax=Micromonospora wenchangensis TaxID=1185415 RepID=A0A246RPR0_9ACTN|nr:hypothetical protein B5D80_09225 [Micromonospora wenchangensis]